MVLVYLYYRKISLGILSLELSEMKQAGEKMSHEKMKKSLSMGAVHSLLLDHLHSVSKIRCSDKNTLAAM